MTVINTSTKSNSCTDEIKVALSHVIEGKVVLNGITMLVGCINASIYHHRFKHKVKVSVANLES